MTDCKATLPARQVKPDLSGLPLRDIVVFPHMIAPSSSGAKSPFWRSRR